MNDALRVDLTIIQNWITPNSRILDLGCGDGSLLRQLMDQKAVKGYGLEIDQDEITQCIRRGINVIEQDLNSGLSNFTDNSFDTVIMTQALQVMRRPDLVLDEMLRVGKECVVTFPNFGNWHARLYLAMRGRMPVTKQLTYQWYDTPNIHFCTVRDFEALCREKSIIVKAREMVSARFPDALLKDLNPNLFSETAIYYLRQADHE